MVQIKFKYKDINPYAIFSIIAQHQDIEYVNKISISVDENSCILTITISSQHSYIVFDTLKEIEGVKFLNVSTSAICGSMELIVTSNDKEKRNKYKMFLN